MKIYHNLERNAPVVNQLSTLAVATNCFNPTKDDFTYLYGLLSDENKKTMLGMAIMIDSLDRFDKVRFFDVETDESPKTFLKIKNEIEIDVLDRTYDWLVNEMCEFLVCCIENEESDDLR